MKRQEFIASAMEIRVLLRILTKMAHQEFQDHLDACGVGISMPHYGVMRLLKHHSYTIKELSKHMLVEPASLVPVVDELERKTFVRRTADPNDRRRTPLVLTAEGDQMLTGLPHLPSAGPFIKTLETMGDEKVLDLLGRLRELAYGMSEDKAMVPELAKTVRMQIGDRSEQAEKKGSGPKK
jgi:MarR family 2-MHQ and catechol resistance regulon transcriptional repressor